MLFNIIALIRELALSILMRYLLKIGSKESNVDFHAGMKNLFRTWYGKV